MAYLHAQEAGRTLRWRLSSGIFWPLTVVHARGGAADSAEIKP
jgi:hypothetical protein